MAYVKLNLPDGTVINEEHLKHIEEGIANAISNSQQTLTEEQKAQARENIGAIAEGSGGSSVQSDWNQTDETAADFIKNKPFGVTCGDTLTVPMMSEDEFNALDPSELVSGLFLKVSDGAPTMQDLSNGFYLSTPAGKEQIPPEEVANFVFEVTDGIISVADLFIFVSEQAVGVEIDGLAFAESGTYVLAEIALYGVPELTIPNFAGFPVYKKLDSEYLPEDYINSLIDAKLGVIENGSY